MDEKNLPPAKDSSQQSAGYAEKSLAAAFVAAALVALGFVIWK